jgi:hypothetical protein
MDMTWLVAEDGLHVEAVNFEQDIALTGKRLVEVTSYFDALGEECEPQDAVSFVCGLDGLGWFACPISDFYRQTN